MTKNVHLLHDFVDDLLLVDGVVICAVARNDLPRRMNKYGFFWKWINFNYLLYAIVIDNNGCGQNVSKCAKRIMSRVIVNRSCSQYVESRAPTTE